MKRDPHMRRTIFKRDARAFANAFSPPAGYVTRERPITLDMLSRWLRHHPLRVRRQGRGAREHSHLAFPSIYVERRGRLNLSAWRGGGPDIDRLHIIDPSIIGTLQSGRGSTTG